MSGEPIKLGSALQPRLIFKDGSTITTDATGIQACSVVGQCADGANVFNYIPAAGATFQSVFGNTYIPANFKVDYTGGGAQVTYLKGGAAEVTLSFKRPDPQQTGIASRKVSEDTAFKHVSDIIAYILSQGAGNGIDDGQQSFGIAGIPEPVLTVTYNNPTLPSVGDGPQYAVPGSNDALGFPICFPLTVTQHYQAITDFTTGCIADQAVNFIFKPSAAGWQLQGKKAEPVADQSFYAITETWRMIYIFDSYSVASVTFRGTCP